MSRATNSSNRSAQVPLEALWKANCFVLDMYAARGYKHDVKRFQRDRSLFEEFVTSVKNDLTQLRVWATDKRGDAVCACMIPDKQFKKDHATKLCKELGSSVRRLIIVWSQPGSPKAILSLKEHFALETWTYQLARSQFHRHSTVPMQRKLTGREKRSFFKTCRLTAQTISSTMHTSTAMARFLGVVPGDVVHIWRTTYEGTSRAYRLVK